MLRHQELRRGRCLPPQERSTGDRGVDVREWLHVRRRLLQLGLQCVPGVHCRAKGLRRRRRRRSAQLRHLPLSGRHHDLQDDLRSRHRLRGDGLLQCERLRAAHGLGHGVHGGQSVPLGPLRRWRVLHRDVQRQLLRVHRREVGRGGLRRHVHGGDQRAHGARRVRRFDLQRRAADQQRVQRRGGCRAVSTPCAPFACDASGRCAPPVARSTPTAARLGSAPPEPARPASSRARPAPPATSAPSAAPAWTASAARPSATASAKAARSLGGLGTCVAVDRGPVAPAAPARAAAARASAAATAPTSPPVRTRPPTTSRRGVLRRQALGVRRRGQLPHRLSVRRQPHVREPDEVQGLLRGRQRLREGLRVRGGKVRDDAAAEVLGRRPLVDPLRRNRCTLRALSVRHDRRLQEAVHDHRRLRARQRVRHRGEAVRPRRNRAERLGRVRAHSRWFGERKRPRCWARPRGGRAHASAARS